MFRPRRCNMVRSDSYCERMCSLMRRSGRARFIVWDRSGRHPVDPGIESAAEMFRGLEIGNKYSMEKSTNQRKPVLYVWASRGKCAPYAVPRRIRPLKSVEDFYSAIQHVRLPGVIDTASLKLCLMRSDSATEVPHRRRNIMFARSFCPELRLY
ncbi:hypothetical protein GCK32_001355 [Trichostrongylus colubriformis]|uniref:Uncharacterized protein n=1 Tax=Trichostrongylus colubriformis TaxID=6319 RepID=A0AAN8FYE6_TRICO